MKGFKGQRARKSWKRMGAGKGISNREFIHMMMSAETFSRIGQNEIDKKRSKKKEVVAGIEVTE